MTVNKLDKNVNSNGISIKVVKYWAEIREHGLLGMGTVGDPKGVGEKLSRVFDIVELVEKMWESRDCSKTPRPGFLSEGRTGREGSQEVLLHCTLQLSFRSPGGWGNPLKKEEHDLELLILPNA